MNQVECCFPGYLVKSTQSGKDKFQTLCHVRADISDAPHTSKLVATGQMGFMRRYDVVLLVGLTELKAQVAWTDSKTVRGHLVRSARTPSHPIYICANLGDREKVCSNAFQIYPP